MSLQEFRDFVRIFTTSLDAEQHQQAIIAILDPLDLDIEYKKLAQNGSLQRIIDIFSSFAEADSDELLTEYEQTRLEQVGTLTNEYFATKNYVAFADMIYHLLLESLSEKYDFGVAEGEEIPSRLIYETLPEEIQLQIFLLENMASQAQFNWKRNDDIVLQSLIVLTVCFSDVYTFLVENEELSIDDELVD